MSAIVLDTSHTDELVNLLKQRRTFSKQEISDSILNNTIDRSIHCLQDTVADRIVGAFTNNKLTSILSQSISSKIPVWIMNFYATDSNTISIKGYGSDLESCFLKAMTDAEDVGIYDFWWSVPVAYAKNGPRLQRNSTSWSRYEVYTDAVVPANQYPKYELHTQAYGKLLKPHDVFIRHAVLKQEFRTVPLTA